MKGSAFALAGMIVLSAPAVTQAKDASVPFSPHVYESPQPSDPIFAQTWPTLIEENNRATVEALPKIKIPPGTNAGIALFTARVPIPGGQAIISIAPRVGLRPLCNGLAIGPHDNYPHNMTCLAHLTIFRNGMFKTSDIGTVCTLYSEEPRTPATSARAVYDATNDSIRLYVMINGRHVERSDGGDGDDPLKTNAGPCDRIIPLPR
ncbi:hypothetical protein SAMN05519103_08488 [Rhizobiales bacterium GAS113]|nr:hypothetical protein SAMN05519103_08488 [Rhizobiales bacterium GAS113]